MARSLSDISGPGPRLVIGLMSGTSLDGVDAALARIRGSGREIVIELIAFTSTAYPDDLREMLMRNSAVESSNVRDLSQLNFRLAIEYSRAVEAVAGEAGVSMSDIALIGSHGQTVHHVPVARDCAGELVASTLQIGDPSVLANLTQIPVVGDLRVADMALGGQGAPLVPYFDFVYFSSESETRGLLNLGGIANISILPAGGGPQDVIAFDTGPANMLIDGLTSTFYGEPFDHDGHRASAGSIDDEFLAELLLTDPYLDQEPPKSTGREHYNADYLRRVINEGRQRELSDADIIATATTFTAATIYQAYARFIRAHHSIDILIAAGGGRHNGFLMDKLADTFAPIRVEPVDNYGVTADAKEALCFAVLAHETVNGVATSLPSVTGASRPAILGKICIPNCIEHG